MDFSPTGLVKLILPRTPLILKTTVLSKLYLSSNSPKQDTTTEVVVEVIRSIVKVKKPVGRLQYFGCKDPGVRGSMWVAKTVIPVPEASVRDALVHAIQELGNGQETYTLPDIRPVTGEWNGHRSNVSKDAHLPDVSQEGLYKSMMEGVESRTTILYFHGGGYMIMDPASHRQTTVQLAKKTKGRAFSVRYRLAPQDPFPSQLLDALIAYLSLLSPPPGSFHEPVEARHILFAGDSAGGNLSLALLQSLLTMQRSGRHAIRFHGKEVPIQLPAGALLNSPWCDIACSLPSWKHNLKFDYLEGPPTPGVPSGPAPDQFWPTQPPRVQIYCDGSVLTHPLASPIAATSDLWKGAPPVFICYGNECLEDEIKVTARRIYRSGTVVKLHGYEGMPHCFSMIFPTSSTARDCWDEMVTFCNDAVNGTLVRTESSKWTKAFSKGTESVTFSNISNLADDEVSTLMKESQAGTLAKERELRADWQAKEFRAHL